MTPEYAIEVPGRGGHYEPQDSLEGVRQALRSGEVSLSGRVSKAIAADLENAQQEASSLLDAYGASDDSLYPTLKEGYLWQVRNAHLTLERANLRNPNLILRPQDETERAAFHEQILVDYLQTINHLTAEDRLTRTVLRRNPVLYQEPADIAALVEQFKHVPLVRIQEEVSNSNANPHAGLKAYCERMGMPLTPPETELPSPEAAVRAVRMCIRDGVVRTDSRPPADLRQKVNAAHEQAREHLVKCEIESYSLEEQSLIREAVAHQVRLLVLASHRAWREALTPDLLTTDEEYRRAIARQLLEEHLAMIQKLRRDDEVSNALLNNHLVLYQDPEGVDDLARQTKEIPRSIVLRYCVSFPRDPVMATRRHFNRAQEKKKQSGSVETFRRADLGRMSRIKERLAAAKPYPDHSSLEPIKRITNHALLEHDEVIVLGRLVKAGNEEAKDILVQHNMRLVANCARRYQGLGLELSDLISEGTRGLIRAVEKYDYGHGFRFSTYATHHINFRLQRALEDMGRTIRIPVKAHRQLSKISRASKELLARGVKPTPETLAWHTDMSPEVVAKRLEDDKRSKTASLNAKVGDTGNAEFGDLLRATEAVEDVVVRNEEKQEAFEVISSALQSIDAVGRDIIVRRHGIGMNPQKPGEVAAELGMSVKAVCRLEEEALQSMAAFIGSERAIELVA